MEIIRDVAINRFEQVDCELFYFFTLSGVCIIISSFVQYQINIQYYIILLIFMLGMQ